MALSKATPADKAAEESVKVAAPAEEAIIGEVVEEEEETGKKLAEKLERDNTKRARVVAN